MNCFFFNCNEGKNRDHDWDDCKDYGFLAAGGQEKFVRQIQRLSPGDIVYAYLKKCTHNLHLPVGRPYGYVGMGLVKKGAILLKDFRVDGPLLTNLAAADGKGVDSLGNLAIGGSVYINRTSIIYSGGVSGVNCVRTGCYVVAIDWIKTLEKERAVNLPPIRGSAVARLSSPTLIDDLEERFR